VPMAHKVSRFVGLAVTICVLAACAPSAIDSQEDVVASGPVDESLVPEALESEFGGQANKPEVAATFAQPWPTRFSRQDLINTAQSRAFEFFDQKSQGPCDFSARFDFQNAYEYKEELKTLADTLVRSFCDGLTFNPVIVVGDYDFLRQSMADSGSKTDDFGGVCGMESVDSSTWGCALYETAWMNETHRTPKDLRGLVVHELFHLVQDSTSPDPPSWRTPPGDPKSVPNWLKEGSATFFEAMVPTYSGTDAYLDFVKGQVELRPGSSGTIQLRNLEDGWSPAVYQVGQFATEYLVANTSIDSLMNVWKFRNEGLTFEQAFLKSFGISVAEFYDITSRITITE